ncbi:hypothetical protein ACFOLJ_30780 [Rugamonas sp. CCM 8940]|uniref:hypothetical protein n=1 Tax=Rugamonas sp. CCM 8940 TaxID=2765359 RepID=UPI0018F69CA2|nr:hypothetical protein [Rugamonas sp. CCM 8940]MBJ7309262.1 hypothetical protein [Rugamonas sp. CCM 8940]
MSKQAQQAALAAAKARLIGEGELYRIGVVHAKARLAMALRPEALMHGAVEHAVGLAQARFGALLQPGGLSGLNLKMLMPYALTVGSFVVRKRLFKPALGVGVALAAGVAWLLRRKRAAALSADDNEIAD